MKLISAIVFFFCSHIADLDECTMGVHSCSHMCHNTLGSYACSCKEGYQLQSDKLHCLGTEADK